MAKQINAAKWGGLLFICLHGIAWGQPPEKASSTGPLPESTVAKSNSGGIASAKSHSLGVKELVAPEVAIEKSLALLSDAAKGSSDQRMCFTCHGQAMPVITLSLAAVNNFSVDHELIDEQVEHTLAHLRRGKKQYLAGKGQGGGVDTAGYALWTLEDGEQAANEVTDAVVDYLLKKQKERGNWQHSSDRPPSEASSFTTTYLALRGLSVFADQELATKVNDAGVRAAEWLEKAKPLDTEDQVFGLLTAELLNADYSLLSEDDVQVMAKQLLENQRKDGGWAQTSEMDSDAYATATVLYALYHAGVSTEQESWQRGIEYLRSAQLSDGSWYVKSRSKPFQTYFETGFPHGKDQFISTSATAWATVALLYSLPGK